MKSKNAMAVRCSSLALIVVLGVSAGSMPATAGEPCCSITALDARTQMVTARETRTGRTLQFKVADTRTFSVLKVGQVVHADFTTMRVSLNPDGAEPCCGIVNLRAPAR